MIAAFCELAIYFFCDLGCDIEFFKIYYCNPQEVEYNFKLSKL